MSYITAIGTAVPAFRFDQSTICQFMENTMGKGDGAVGRKIRAVFRASGIRQRYSVLDDYGKTGDFSFYPNNNEDRFPGTDTRMKVFKEHALPLSCAAVSDMLKSASLGSLSDVTHLIVVSCTGMYAPGLDIELVRALKLETSIQRICIQFMGCYAAFNALKVADAICRNEAAQKVLIVCTELCSIHFQQTPSEDNILANALFADGSACMLVEPDPSPGNCFDIRSFYNDLVSKGENDMAWNIGDEGFQMRLSSYVPDLIRGEVRSLICSLLSAINPKEKDIGFYALHPGGVRILRTIEEELGLTPADNESAYRVLKQYGNMSSATVVFVLKDIMDRIAPVNNNQYVLSMGFGPGLTLESMLLRICSVANG